MLLFRIIFDEIHATFSAAVICPVITINVELKQFINMQLF